MWDYRAKCLHVTDGDTLKLLVDTGFYQRAEIDVRLDDVWAPEIKQPGGLECREFVMDWLSEWEHRPGVAKSWPLLVVTSVGNRGANQRKTFTRYVGTVWPMMDAGLAAPDSLNVAVRGFAFAHPEWGQGVT